MPRQDILPHIVEAFPHVVQHLRHLVVAAGGVACPHNPRQTASPVFLAGPALKKACDASRVSQSFTRPWAAFDHNLTRPLYNPTGRRFSVIKHTATDRKGAGKSPASSTKLKRLHNPMQRHIRQDRKVPGVPPVHHGGHDLEAPRCDSQLLRGELRQRWSRAFS